MARTLSSNILTQIQAEGVRIVHLLKLDTSTAIKAGGGGDGPNLPPFARQRPPTSKVRKHISYIIIRASKSM